MTLLEIQVDRIVGPTHHFGGLGVGNLASQQYAGQTSNPAAAALQGLEKMQLVASLGVVQAIVPPQPRPAFDLLRSLGFQGSDAEVLRRAAGEAPGLLSAAASSSAMWTANAATATPGIDTAGIDTAGRGASGAAAATLTVANLVASLHRAIEPSQTRVELAELLGGDGSRVSVSHRFRVHGPLPGGSAMRDEGAANHMRLGTTANRPGINVFVYGDGAPEPKHHRPRQSRAASEAVARLHELPADNTFFLRQHPSAIDAGAFHNDVVAMSHHGLLIHHESAFDDDATLNRLVTRYAALTGESLCRIEVSEHELSLADAVKTYLFNSQIVSPPDRTDPPVIVCTSHVRANESADALVQRWCRQGVFSEVHYVDLTQSMSGGGGPACLRLRIPWVAEPDAARDAISSPWTESLGQRLKEVIGQHYETTLTLQDLARVEFHQEAQNAQRQVARLLRRPVA